MAIKGISIENLIPNANQFATIQIPKIEITEKYSQQERLEINSAMINGKYIKKTNNSIKYSQNKNK